MSAARMAASRRGVDGWSSFIWFSRPVDTGRAGISLDHPIRAQQQWRGKRYSQKRGGPSVEHELECRRALHRQIADIRALEDPRHLARRASLDIAEIRSVRHQPTCVREVIQVRE